MNDHKQVLSKLPQHISGLIRELPSDILENMEEIRLSVNGGIRVISRNEEYMLQGSGSGAAMDAVNSDILGEILNNLLDYSYYAYEEELAKGYITIESGHRVGVCGRVVSDKGKITLIKDISSLNLRCGREVRGASDKIIDHVLSSQGTINNTLIVSPPKCGKTTILRDITRSLSCRGFRIGLCDERSEIAGMHMGRPGYDMGPRTDILDGCPKAEGMVMLIRAMSPDIVITDEIGKREDVSAIETAVCAGVKIITSIHGSSGRDVLDSGIGEAVSGGVFNKIIFLCNTPHTGAVREIREAGEITYD